MEEPFCLHPEDVPSFCLPFLFQLVRLVSVFQGIFAPIIRSFHVNLFKVIPIINFLNVY